MSKTLLGLTLLSAALFFFVTLLVWQGLTTTIDFDFTVKLQDHIPRLWDSIPGTLVELGSVEIMTGVLILTLWRTKQSLPKILLILFLYLLGMVGVVSIKHLIHHPAPAYMFQRDSGATQFSMFYVQIESSYPSGHTYRAFFVSTLLTLILMQKKNKTMYLTWIPMIFALAVASSLILLGKHWLSDVIGGGSLAVMLASWIGFSRKKSV